MPAVPSQPVDPVRHRFAHGLRRRPRFNFAACAFLVLSGTFVAFGVQPERALLLGFDAAAVVFLLLLAHMFTGADAAGIRTRAQREDQGRWGVLWTGVMLSAVVLVALGLELHAGDGAGVLQIVLAAGTLMLSWLFMNILFAVHYAHAYYGDDTRRKTSGGLQFPGGGDPDYWDFAYFAIVIGMTFQVSDVQITDRALRRAVLLHSVIAFFFDVVIIAITVNVVAGRG